jgi:hypothetical protein
MTGEKFHPSLRTLIKRTVPESQQELDLHFARIRLTAYEMAQLRAKTYRSCPKQTLPPLPSVRQPLLTYREDDQR